jgi:hypothetical protein
VVPPEGDALDRVEVKTDDPGEIEALHERVAAEREKLFEERRRLAAALREDAEPFWQGWRGPDDEPELAAETVA